MRSTGRTAMNAHSSRSHAICTFYLRVIESAAQALAEGQEDFSRAIVSKLHLVDLAGSERAKKTQVRSRDQCSVDEGVTCHVHVPGDR